MTVKRSNGSVKRRRRNVAKARMNGGANGRVDVVSPATASEIRRTLGIGKTQVQNALRALKAAGVII